MAGVGEFWGKFKDRNQFELVPRPMSSGWTWEPVSEVALRMLDPSSPGISHPLCESPIEARLFKALTEAEWLKDCLQVWDCTSREPLPRAPLVLCPQFRMAGFRVDFLLIATLADDRQLWLAIECDGRQHHGSTVKQIMRDLGRDLILNQLGTGVVRFTGSQIHNDPEGCAAEVVDFIWHWSSSI